MEKCPTETYTPLGMAKLGAEPEPLIKAKMTFLIFYAFCDQICVEKCPTETYTPLGMAKLGAEPEPLIKAVFRIRIHGIHMFFGLPDPDPLVRGMDPDPALDPDPSIIMQK